MLPRRPILIHVAERVGIGRLADHAVVDRLALRRQPAEHLDRPVDGVAFLVARDQQADRAGRRALMSVQEPLGRRDEGGDGPLHVGGAAAEQLAVLDRRGVGVDRPALARAFRHDIGVPCEAEVRGLLAEPRIEVVDPLVALAERQPRALEVEPFERPLQHVERARVPSA